MPWDSAVARNQRKFETAFTDHLAQSGIHDTVFLQLISADLAKMFESA
jgi:hypothetical protein